MGFIFNRIEAASFMVLNYLYFQEWSNLFKNLFAFPISLILQYLIKLNRFNKFNFIQNLHRVAA